MRAQIVFMYHKFADARLCWAAFRRYQCMGETKDTPVLSREFSAFRLKYQGGMLEKEHFIIVS